MKNFFDQKCNLLLSKLQEKTSTLKREHPALQKRTLRNFFLCLWVIFVLLDRIANSDPDTDPGTQLNPDPIRIWIHSTGSTTSRC